MIVFIIAVFVLATIPGLTLLSILAVGSVFGSNEELTEERRQAGAVVESGIMTMISEKEFFTSLPETFVAE